MTAGIACKREGAAVQVSARVDYAMRAVVQIARRPDSVTTKRELSELQDIPPRFLENILLQLVRSNLLAVTRGSLGGYSLAREPASITVADVVRAIDGPLAGVRGAPPEQLEYPESSKQVQAIWVALRSSMRSVLEDTTVDALVTGDLPAAVAELLRQPGAWTRR
ncbi:Rrf2 family transcriptional regulator [Glaciihabitans sp. INWT7]|uniref:RrF2 family transcriptional regulator n=1 Tax=Glaciihabitans sp. INWT7 TaxID=2596912 RepID=UPI0021040361|nr:Rrf2 family transcriptional regulator [Glaciihabitans sp. INWT7]